MFATYVSARRPIGALPATFGHLQTLADLIDEWDNRMFWGHKADGNPNYAGTSSTWLPPPHKHQLYGGLMPLNMERLVNMRSTSGLSSQYDSLGTGYVVY